VQPVLVPHVDQLKATGVTRIAGPFEDLELAWTAAERVVARAADPVEVIGEFVVPPPFGPASRKFQTLHLDFGLPLLPVVPADVARFTALHMLADRPASEAWTRLVPLRSLLRARRWPGRDELLRRIAAYGASHGAWDDAHGYFEGSLARLIEASLGETPVLPSVKTHVGFLCGEEFAGQGEEERFLSDRGLRPDVVGFEVCLGPGELLLFDNLAVARTADGGRVNRASSISAFSVTRTPALNSRANSAIASWRHSPR
jgi:hypothetical protein